MNRESALHTIRQQTPTDNQSFEQTYKEAYSHGLEAIYALENIDLSKIKPMQVEVGAEKPTLPKKVLHPKKKVPEQLTFNLIRKASPWFDPTTHQFLNGNWIQSLFHTLPQKGAFCILEHYGLESLIELTPFQKIEISRMTTAEKAETLKMLHNEKLTQKVQSEWATLSEWVFFDWIHQFHGVVALQGLVERMESLAEYPELIEPMMALLTELFFEGRAPFAAVLEEVGEGLYAMNAATANHVKTLIDVALTYFYVPSLIYPFTQFVSWIERECAKQWIGFPEGFVAHALRTTHTFSVRKVPDGDLVVRLH